MGFASLEEVRTFCEEQGIKMIDFKTIDLHGRWRHLTIPAKRFTQALLNGGIGFDGSNYGFASLEKSDMVFIPDLSTGITEPFMEVPTLSMIGDVYVIDNPNRRFNQDPRSVAYHAQEYMKKSGIADEMRIAPEFEYYIFDHISHEVKPQEVSYRLDVEQAEWNSGQEDWNQGYKVPHKEGYHITPPMDSLHDLRSRVCLLLEERGVGIKYHHHEVGGPGQQEIEIESGPMLEMADKTMLIKYLIKNAAFAAGKTATFMPKPILGEAGSGMHVHMHLFKDGAPLFYDEKGYSGLSDTALYFMGGLLKHAPALCAFTNPSTNSYRRLVPGYEAPVSICFATSNRSAVVRIPGYAKEPAEKRFEIRSPDGTCNPYFAFAAILMAGLEGVQKKIDPTAHGFGPYDVNIYRLSKEERAKIKPLPTSLMGALDALEEDYEFLLAGNVFPKELIDTWIEKKRQEAAAINLVPHPAEFAAYFDL